MDNSKSNSGGIYIHVPFCRSKCIYCDFYTAGARIAGWDAFTNCLLNELKTRQSEIDFDIVSLYLGGGTPSIMPSRSFHKLIEGIRDIAGKPDIKEFTIEANPEDVTPINCGVWRESGINRVSLGVQTLNDDELKIIGRKHNASKALNALSLLLDNFVNVSTDIMFGIPGQTLESFSNTLENILRLRPQHISSYSLMLEEGTAMTLLANKKALNLPDEDTWIEMHDLMLDRLSKNGYRHYEISNFSLNGFQSLHNYNYWMGRPYIGLGPGAHSFNGVNIRRANPNDLKGYLKYFNNLEPQDERLDNDPFFIQEILDEKEMMEEMIMTRLRTAEGLSLIDYQVCFGSKETDILLKKASAFITESLLKKENGQLSLTETGVRISDHIISSLF